VLLCSERHPHEASDQPGDLLLELLRQHPHSGARHLGIEGRSTNVIYYPCQNRSVSSEQTCGHRSVQSNA